MQHLPIFIDLRDRHVALAGGGAAALAKLRLLLKTQARLSVFAPAPAPEIAAWAAEGRVTLHPRPLRAEDLRGTTLVYAATEDATEDARIADLARAGRQAG